MPVDTRVGPPGQAASFQAGRASGRASIEVTRVGDHSVVSRAYATSPVRLLTPRNHGHGAWVFTSTFGGGMVDGDHVVMDIDVARDATAYVSTQASTKVYRSPSGTSAQTQIRVAAGGLLVLIPDPVVCFAGSRYRQVQEVDLAPGAGLVLVDWLTSGRHASGERWAFDAYDARVRVTEGGRLRVHEALRLDGEDGDIGGRLGAVDAVAVVVVCGRPLESLAAGIVSRVARTPATRGQDTWMAAAPLERGGCVARLAGRSAERIARTLREWLGEVPTLLGDDPWGRKW